MTARFLVNSTFTFASRGMLMLIGDIKEGFIRVGARVVSGADIEVPLSGVEMGCRGGGLPCTIALGFRYSDKATLDRWLDQKLEGVVLVLENPTIGK